MTIDRFDVMLAHLTGKSIPPLPAIPGRVFKTPDADDGDPGLVAFELAQAERARCAGPEPPQTAIGGGSALNTGRS